MRTEIFVCRLLQNWKFWIEIGWKCRIRLCQILKFRFFQNWVSEKWKIGTPKLEIRFRVVVFGIEIQNLFQKFKILVSKNEKSGPQNLNFDFGFSILVPEIWFSKFQNRFPSFLANLVSRPKNLKSAMSKTPNASFSLPNSYFRFKFFFDQNTIAKTNMSNQNLDFVLG